LREDYPPAVALCVSAASLSAREECGKQLPRILRGRPFACMPSSRLRDATVLHTIVPPSPTRTRLWIRVSRVRGARRYPWKYFGHVEIWHRHNLAARLKHDANVLCRNYADLGRLKLLIYYFYVSPTFRSKLLKKFLINIFFLEYSLKLIWHIARKILMQT